MHLIRQGAMNRGSVADLAERLGVGSRHLRRLFRQHIGATPKAIADNQRLLFAKRLVVETDMPITQAALAAGYGSIRRFNAAFRKGTLAGRRPSFAETSPPGTPVSPMPDTTAILTLTYRPPYDWDRMLAFFRERAIPGVEWADERAPIAGPFICPPPVEPSPCDTPRRATPWNWRFACRTATS